MTEGGIGLQLDNGVEMAFTDQRRFARVRLLPDVNLPLLNSCCPLFVRM